MEERSSRFAQLLALSKHADDPHADPSHTIIAERLDVIGAWQLIDYFTIFHRRLAVFLDNLGIQHAP